MRDPKRITPLLTELSEQWKKFPDWRFGQLIENIKRFYGVDDLFFIRLLYSSAVSISINISSISLLHSLWSILILQY